MRSLICFAFLMSASICMLVITPVQASANGDAASTLTASPSDNSHSVLADDDADGEIEDKTQEQIKKEKDEYDVEIAAREPGISDVQELIDSEGEKLKDAGLETTDDLIALGWPDPDDYDTDDDWQKAMNKWMESQGATTLEDAFKLMVRWFKAKDNSKLLAAYKTTKNKLEDKESKNRKREGKTLQKVAYIT